MTRKLTPQSTWYDKYLAYGILGILAIIPFHAPITVWLASVGLNYEFVRLWKELILIILLILAVSLVWKNKKTKSSLLNDSLVRLVLCFVGLTALNALLVLVTDKVSPKAVGYGLIVDTRIWLFFLVVAISIKLKQPVKVPKFIIGPAVFVIGFGLLQMTLLPNDFLRHIGYGPSTIVAYQSVDSNAEFSRAQSTMRGPNPLGAYLLPVCMLLMAGWLRFKRHRVWFGIALTASLILLFATYSRSAWIGLGLSMILFVGWGFSSRYKILAALILSGVVLLAGAGIYALRNNDLVQNVFFHSSEASPSATSSNEQRANALSSGIKDIVQNPLGGGVGSAGPASVYNANPKISENFFIQIGQELGIPGLLLFVALIFVSLQRVYLNRGHMVAFSVMVSYIGLILVNMLSHAWSDDTLAYVMGALLAYGIFAYSSIQNTNK